MLWAFAIGGRPAEQANPLAFLRALPPRKPLPKPKRRRAPAPPPAPLPPKPIKPTLGTKSAERLLRALLRRRPRSEVDIRAAVAVASISARTLEAAANRLGVQTAGGQWRLAR